MSDLNVKSDSVDVEQIMKQIRSRIREKRGSDYTEAELQQLASAKFEQFADPSGLRSDLLEQFRKRGDEPSTYHRHRGIRRVLLMMVHPVLKRVQKQVMSDLNLYFEIIHNLVIEVTKLGIENHNLKMKVESLSSRLDFDERRGRALEGAVQYRQPRQHQPQHAGPTAAAASATAASPCGAAADFTGACPGACRRGRDAGRFGSGGPADAGRTSRPPASPVRRARRAVMAPAAAGAAAAAAVQVLRWRTAPTRRHRLKAPAATTPAITVTTETTELPISEAGGCCSALRRGHQRRS